MRIAKRQTHNRGMRKAECKAQKSETRNRIIHLLIIANRSEDDMGGQLLPLK